MSDNGRRRDSIFAGERGLPARPFRTAALFYGALAVIGFFFLLATGQSVGRAAIGAAFAFVLGTGWTWLRFSRAQREERRREGRKPS
jgi:threonine/homoserine efflux transporter RhtA